MPASRMRTYPCHPTLPKHNHHVCVVDMCKQACIVLPTCLIVCIEEGIVNRRFLYSVVAAPVFLICMRTLMMDMKRTLDRCLWWWRMDVRWTDIRWRAMVALLMVSFPERGREACLFSSTNLFHCVPCACFCVCVCIPANSSLRTEEQKGITWFWCC